MLAGISQRFPHDRQRLPLLRFDGYYILSDLLEIPNLQIRAARQFVYWLERHGGAPQPRRSQCNTPC